LVEVWVDDDRAAIRLYEDLKIVVAALPKRTIGDYDDVELIEQGATVKDETDRALIRG
jgi:hypothetical protein